MPPSIFRRAKIDLKSPDGKVRTVPELIDYNVKHNRNHAFCVQSRKQEGPVPYGFRTISNLELKHAILKCSNWLLTAIAELELPFEGDDGTTFKGLPVALLVDSDFGLLLHLLSMMSLGVPVVLLSARLSPTAIHHLLVKTSSRALIVSPRLKHSAKQALSLFSVEET
ncbi:hypothetical protein MMC30_008751, partial [Trapelia coarctata]|nr:hypothetical protein [Trapelia coarctata]